MPVGNPVALCDTPKKLLPVRTGGKVYYQSGNVYVFYGCKLHMRIARSTCAFLTIWLQRMFENGNIISVYSPLVDRLGLGLAMLMGISPRQ